MNAKHEYKEHYVAFIDVLGFKEFLSAKTTCEDVYAVFKSLIDNSHSTMFYNGEDVSAFHHVKHYIMSDSIVLYIQADIEEAFLALLGTCVRLQRSLLYQNKPILLRGGIAKGPLFVENNIIYGKGLSDAYQIESNVSIYPRIVFNKELLIFSKKHNQSSKRQYWEGMFTREDEDEFLFVHYLAMFGNGDLDDIPAIWDNVLKYCQLILNSSYNMSIREKYLWLKHYIIKEATLQRSFLKGLRGGKEFLITQGIGIGDPNKNRD